MRSIFKTAAVAAAVLAAGLVGTVSQADTIYNSNFQGGASATITYTTGTKHNGFPYTTSESAGVGAFSVTQVGTSNGTAFDAYCASLNIKNPKSDPINIVSSQELTLNTLTKDNSNYFQYTSYNDVGNRLAFLLGNYNTIADGLAKENNTTYTEQEREAALSLAIWKTIDANFKYSNLNGGYGFSSNDVGDLYDQLVDFDGYYAGRGRHKQFVPGNGYDANTTYSQNAVLLLVSGTDGDPSKPYQNLIGIIPGSGGSGNPGGPAAGTVPEPASLVSILIGLGASGLFAARRKVAA